MNPSRPAADLAPAPPAVRPARLETLVRAQLRAAAAEAEDRGEELTFTITGASRPVRLDASRASRALASMLSAAVRLSRPGAHLRADVWYGATLAVVSVDLEIEAALDLERSGLLHAALDEARCIVEECGGSLRVSARSLAASFPFEPG